MARLGTGELAESAAIAFFAQRPDRFLQSIRKWNLAHPDRPQITRVQYIPSPEYVEWAKQMDQGK